MTKRPISIYIHIPFCVKKCDYCDFLSGVATPDERSFYISKLIEEIESDKRCSEYIVDTVFFGGGTPSLLSVEQLKEILCKLKEKYEFAPGAEISLECNPGTVNKEYLENIRELGINRLSIGAQSFNDNELKLLGRIHNSAQILEAFSAARLAGFDNINLDIISSIPDQNSKSFLVSLKKAIELSPEHLSVYSLIIEEGTKFYDNIDDYCLPDEDEVVKIDELTSDYLEKNGYSQYEISNYAKKGYECRHNLTYWKRGEYRGYGLGAASFIKNADRQLRFSAEADMNAYYGDCSMDFFERKNAGECSYIEPSEAEFEYIMLSLRLNEGIKLSDFSDKYGDFKAKYALQNERFVKASLTEFYTVANEEYYHLTKRGRQVANAVMSEYILE